MIKGIVIIIGLFLTLHLKSQPCLKDFEIKDSTFYLNNKIYSGEYKCFADNGVLLGDGLIKDGKFNGITSYYKNGILIEKVLYRNNVEIRRTFYKKTILDSMVYSMRNNVLDSLWEKYFSNGKIREKGLYKNGILIDTFTNWNIFGKRVEQFINTDTTFDYRLFKYKKDGIYIKVKRTDKRTNKTSKFVLKE